MQPLHRLIDATSTQLRLNRLLRSLLVGGAVGLLMALLPVAPPVAILVGLVAAGLAAWRFGAFSSQRETAIGLLHQTLGDTEYSLSLLSKPHPNLAEQLQLDRLNDRATQLPRPFVGLYQLRPYVLAFTATLLAFVLVKGLATGPGTHRANNGSPRRLGSTPQRPAPPVPPSLRSARLSVQPPAYMNLPQRTSTDLNVTAYVGSTLRWTVQLSQSNDVRVALVNSRGDELPFTRQNDAFTYQDRVLNSGLYALRAYWRTPDRRDSLVYQSDFYRLEARPDAPPIIRPSAKDLYRFHRLGDPTRLVVDAQITDDFRVQGAYIVATLARGSGENVKFRETRFPVSRGPFQSARVSHTLDLAQLGFAPGDELYYYWAAIDNRPEPQLTKSDTYFVVFKDTARADEAQLATMAVNIMPEYFRSQRQIIIDTDKLIAKRKQTPKTAFNEQSNEIGFDQKVLRLRYGQYLGEEFENQIGGHEPLPDNDAHLLDGYMHKHDTQPDGGSGDNGEAKPFAFRMAQEAEARQAAKREATHDHGDQGSQQPGQEKDPLAALMEQYVHNHDNGEVNTFYEQSTRSLLKMALEQMWQSELQLRLYEPEKARPFEQKALEYLKMAQQKARAYAKKSGYDPPPLKEKETRLTGELGDAPEQHRQSHQYNQPPLATLIAQVLGYVDLPNLSAGQRQVVGQLSAALSGPLLQSGLNNWAVVGQLQQLASGRRLSAEAASQLKTKLSRFGAHPTTAARPGLVADRALEAAFWRHLN